MIYYLPIIAVLVHIESAPIPPTAKGDLAPSKGSLMKAKPVAVENKPISTRWGGGINTLQACVIFNVYANHSGSHTPYGYLQISRMFSQ